MDQVEGMLGTSPALQDRGQDTLLLALHFLKQAADVQRKPLRGFTPEALNALCAYRWPGNVRELSNRVRRAVVMAEGMEITPQDLDLTGEVLQSTDSLDSLRAAHRRIEVELIAKAISLHRGNVTRAARIMTLRITRKTQRTSPHSSWVSCCTCQVCGSWFLHYLKC